MSGTSHDPNVPQSQADAGREDSIATPLSEYDALMARLKESPHDPESWKHLVDLAETSGDIARIREAYDALLARYPNTASAQIAYIDHFIDSLASYEEAEELLNKFLRASPSADLWKYYLNYVRRVNSGPKAHKVVCNAYTFALNHIGQDRDSGSIWADYIQFLTTADTTITWQAQQKTDTLRRVYRRAVQIPLDNVEQLWKQYKAFEAGLDKITAEKFISDLSLAHMQARTVLRQLSANLEGLGSSKQSGIFLPSPATYSPQERQLLRRWKMYLKWEAGNPLQIEDKDRNVLVARIEKAYRKAVIRMRYYPEIWFMAYSWSASVGKNEEGISILKAGLEPNPDSFLLTYAYVELLEKAELKKDQRDYNEIHSVYERFLGVLRANLARIADAAYPPGPEVNADAALAAAQITQQEFTTRKNMYSNAWINYMRFAQRAQRLKASRDAFKMARKDEYIGWQVYEAAAMTEYRCNREDGRLVATRIFEVGMKKFGSDVSYVLAQLNFLLTVNEENKARALFERAIGTFTSQAAKPIWECWSRSQYQYADLEAVLELERCMAEIHPNDTAIKRFAQRHKYNSIDAIADHDLGFAMARKSPAGAMYIASSVPGGGPNPSVNPNTDSNSTLVPSNPSKRSPPPDSNGKNDYKRMRLDERDRDRRIYSPSLSEPRPSSERRRDVKPPMPPRRGPPWEKLPIPHAIHWFMEQLPPRETFDGPVPNPGNLMDILRDAIIPATTHARSPPSRRQGRPPPTYAPYEGPCETPYEGPGSTRTRRDGRQPRRRTRCHD
ncbi:Suf-domain-containing protein [Mycena polygramma]|nr:Suf-domain-containing protein [Mycena polygramma]